MIITKEFAEKMNKETLAELATKYCNELAEKLGSDKKIEVKPGEAVFNPKEAKAMLPILLWQHGSDKFDFYLAEKQIKNARAFFVEGMAFTPLTCLSETDTSVFSKASGMDNGEIFKKLEDSHITIRGFGAEMGHLVSSKLYENRTLKTGLDEALDILSNIHEISYDAKMLCKAAGIDDEGIENKMVEEKVKLAEEKLIIYELLLFKGDEAAKRHLISQGRTCEEAEKSLSYFKSDYVMTRHFEGIKIFLDAYNHERKSLERTFKKLGELSATKCYDTLDVLYDLAEDNSKYFDAFEQRAAKRAGRLSLKCDIGKICEKLGIEPNYGIGLKVYG